MLQAYARRGSRVTEVVVPGLTHRSPLPPAVRLGSWVFSSVIGGDDLKTNTLPAEPAEQIEQAFQNVKTVMKAAGGDVEGVNHLWVFLADMAHQSTMLNAYLRMFPEEGDRPARKTVHYKLPPGCYIQVQIAGDIGGRQGNFEAPGVGHQDPIPMGSRAGGLLISSGVHGMDAKTSKMTPDGIVAETGITFDNLKTLMKVAGGTLEDIAGLTVLIRDYAHVPIVRAILESHYGAAGLPAIQFANYDLPSILNVQFHVVAARL